MRSNYLFATTAIVAFLASAGAVFAADADDSSPQVEELVVTARKIAEPLQKVPLSISALSSADLDKQGIREPSDLSSVVPGLTFEKDFGRRNERPVIRGQSNVLGVPNVAFFIDGVFIPSSLFSTDLAFVDRVEVIKGPQSALYGRQSFAGAISYINADPSDEWERRVKATVGSYGYVDVMGAISGPLIKDKLGLQLAADYYDFNGEYRNNNPGDSSDREKIGSEHTVAASLALKYTGIENLALTFRAAVSQNDDGPEVVGMQRGALDNCFLNTKTRYYCGAIQVTPADIHSNEDIGPGAGIGRRQVRTSLNAVYDFHNYTLSSITGFTRSYESRKSDLDYLPVAASRLHVDDAWQTQSFSQELRIASPATDRLSWLAGLYYYNSYQDYTRYFYNNNTKQYNGTTKTLNYAAFGLVRFKATDKLSASTEVRYGEDELALVGGSNYHYKATFKSLNPRFTLDYQALPDVLLYASAAKGNKPGGFNTVATLPDYARTYGEEKSWEYEAGTKTELFNHRLRLNASVYYIDWKGQQLTQSLILPNVVPLTTSSYIRNVGDLHVKGAEVEGQFALTRDITLRGSGSVADSHYVRGADPDYASLLGDGVGSIVGKTSPNAPKYTASAGFHAVHDVSFGQLFVDGDYTYRSRKYDQVSNLAYVKGRGTADIRFGADTKLGTFTVEVTNIFDNIDPISVTRYSDFLTTGPLRSFLGAIPPGRRVNISLEKKF